MLQRFTGRACAHICRSFPIALVQQKPARRSLAARASYNEDKMALKGKLALITGSSRGVGEAIAYAYAKEGASLILVAQSEDNLKKVAEAAKSKGARDVEYHPISLNDLDALDKLAKSLIEKHKVIDVIVNNAGILGPFHAELENMGQGPLQGNPDEWLDILRINVHAPMRLLRWLGPAMVEKGEGAVINIASIAGTKGMAGNPAYSTSKNAFTGWSEALHDNLAPKGIKVTCINPAAVATPMTFDRPDMEVEASKENQPEDIAELALIPFRLSRWANVRDLTTTNMIDISK